MTEDKLISRKDVQRLANKGEKQGYLTYEEIFAVIKPDVVEGLDDLFVQLQRHDVPIVDTSRDGERLMRERKATATAAAAAKDALSSYLREITDLPALDREEEVKRAESYREGVVLAMRAVVDARIFVDQVLSASSRIRRQRQSVWDVVDRIRYPEDADQDQTTEEFLGICKKLTSVHQEERRILARLSRRGIKNEQARQLSKKLRSVRGRITDLLVKIPFEPKFLKETASQMISLHARLEEAKLEREALAHRLDVTAAEIDRAISAHRRGDRAVPKGVDLEHLDRDHKRLKRRIRRMEKNAGMDFQALHRAVLRYRAGILKSQRARDALILSAQRLVLSSARYYGRRLGGTGMEVADLISAGNLGLIRAVELFDPGRGNRFSTFAGHWVRHAMIRTIHTQSRTVYVPPHIRQQMSKILACENELIQKQGGSPSDEELAEASGIDIPKLRHTIQSFGRVSSIDRPLDPDDTGSASYGDILAADGLTPAEELEGAERREMVRKLAERLQGRERTIVFLRMGWNNQDPLTLAEIGARFGISRQRVEQLEKRALGKLRRWARTAGLGDSLFGY
ncbi:MAG: sigma-70 family RNA polymerase sigma factor [bacterium]